MKDHFPGFREVPKGVDLRVVPPQGDKHHMIGFDAKTPKEARAYNEAIGHYLDSLKSNSNIFHQVGGDDDALGYHAWEIWDRDIDESKLAALLPKIEADAQILITEDDLDVLWEKVYKRWKEEE
ncbi:MAG: hypothetical protein PHC53_01590 [Patescibacteria group bacterium]|nr:hypothetical protein [Patescibacteria group bacterium]